MIRTPLLSMIKNPLFWKFGSNFIFQINKVWEANKPANDEIKKKGRTHQTARQNEM